MSVGGVRGGAFEGAAGAGAADASAASSAHGAEASGVAGAPEAHRAGLVQRATDAFWKWLANHIVALPS